jgi:iron complex transport system substrate-binding protein
MLKQNGNIRSYAKVGLVLIIILMIIIIPGCIVEEKSEKDKTTNGALLPITIVDDKGNNITIEKFPERIVSLSASATEILYALNLGDKIVGIDAGSNYPEDAVEHEMVFDGFTGLNTEKFVITDPDLVFLNHKLDLSGNARSKIRELGYNIIILDPIILNDVIDNIDLIGKATNRTEEAKVLIEDMETRIDAVEDYTYNNAPKDQIKVLYVVWFGEEGDPWVAGDNNHVDDLIEKAGGTNVISDFEGFETESLEVIVSANPQVIICSQNEVYPTQSRELILADSRLSTLDAVKNGKVYDVNADIVDRPGPRIVEGLERFQELFLDLET